MNIKNSVKALVACVTIALALGGCAASGMGSFVDASDIAANQTVGPAYADYVNADPDLDAAQRETKLNLLQAWRNAVAEARQSYPRNAP